MMPEVVMAQEVISLGEHHVTLLRKREKLTLLRKREKLTLLRKREKLTLLRKREKLTLLRLILLLLSHGVVPCYQFNHPHGARSYQDPQVSSTEVSVVELRPDLLKAPTRTSCLNYSLESVPATSV